MGSEDKEGGGYLFVVDGRGRSLERGAVRHGVLQQLEAVLPERALQEHTHGSEEALVEAREVGVRLVHLLDEGTQDLEDGLLQQRHA